MERVVLKSSWLFYPNLQDGENLPLGVKPARGEAPGLDAVGEVGLEWNTNVFF